MESSNGQTEINLDKARRMMDRIIKQEKRNIQTKQYSDSKMVAKIKEIIREETDAYAD